MEIRGNSVNQNQKGKMSIVHSFANFVKQFHTVINIIVMLSGEKPLVTSVPKKKVLAGSGSSKI